MKLQKNTQLALYSVLEFAARPFEGGQLKRRGRPQRLMTHGDRVEKRRAAAGLERRQIVIERQQRKLVACQDQHGVPSAIE